MKIGELARRSGLRTSAVRFYEQVGVLEPPSRVRGRRHYGANAINALRIVQALQGAGFTLAEIRTLRGLPPSEKSEARWRREGTAKMRELDARIAQLSAARAAIEASLDCACRGSPDACSLIRWREGREQDSGG